MILPPLPRVLRLVVLSCMLPGCSTAQAPSFELFGAYFPAWMLCALIGIVGAASLGVVLRTEHFSAVVPYPLAVCTAVGVIVGLVVWGVLFR